MKNEKTNPESAGNVRTQFNESKGKEAYRVAFTLLSDYCIGMTGGMTNIWVAYWNNHEFRSHITDAIIELNANKKEIIESVKSACKVLLPDNVDMDTEVNIHIIADGNRGYFQFGNNVMMDIIYFDDFSEFLYTLKHEMHHAYYRKWFAEKTSNKERNEGEDYLYQCQESFIFEGIAQRLDFDATYSNEHKQMFANKELITELFDEWITLFRALKGDSPQTVIEMYQENEYERAIERGKKYYPGKNETHHIRPDIQYFLSYNIYNSIFEAAGQEKLKYVIENPDKLLLIYNELHIDSMIVPRIPDDIVRIWQESF